jgi:hypothetical protein
MSTDVRQQMLQWCLRSVRDDPKWSHLIKKPTEPQVETDIVEDPEATDSGTPGSYNQIPVTLNFDAIEVVKTKSKKRRRG